MRTGRGKPPGMGLDGRDGGEEGQGGMPGGNKRSFPRRAEQKGSMFAQDRVFGLHLRVEPEFNHVEGLKYGPDAYDGDQPLTQTIIGAQKKNGSQCGKKGDNTTDQLQSERRTEDRLLVGRRTDNIAHDNVVESQR